MNDQYVSYVDVPEKLDIQSDDTLLISSDIAKVAMNAMRFEKQFDPAKFIDALKRKVEKGTLLFPAFIDHIKSEEFDIKNTIPQTGTLSVTAFRDPSFKRTADPFHSFMVWGKHADELAGIKNKSTFGDNSVFAFMHRHNSKMLTIDIDLQHSFTFAHYVEEMERVSYRKYKKHTINTVDVNGMKEKREVLFYAKRPGIILHLNRLYDLFKKHDVIKEYSINNSLFTIIDLEKSVEIIRYTIHSNAGFNLHHMNYMLWIKSIVKKIIS